MKKSLAVLAIFTSLLFAGCVMKTATKPTETPVEEIQSLKTFEGDGFSFKYPAKYIVDEKGLWTKEGYEEKDDICDFCGIPEFAITVEKKLTIEEMISKYIPDIISQNEPYYNSKVKIENNEFTKIQTHEMGPCYGYFIGDQGKIIGIETYAEPDNEDLRTILSTFNLESLKTFEGNGFTFTYPAKYKSDSVGLWTEEGYKDHINPPEQCDTCQWPLVAVTSQETKGTLDKFVLEYYTLMGTSLEEASQETGIPYGKVQLGDNEFIKVTVSDMVAITGYYAKKGDLIIGFEVSREGGDNDELKEIMSSLKFQ